MPSSNSMLSRFIDTLVQWPKTVLGIFIVVTVALGTQAPSFDIDASPDTLLTRDNALYTQTQLVNERFAPQEFLLVTYQPETHALFSTETFESIANLSEDLLSLERVDSVRSILNVPIFPEGTSMLRADLDLASLAIEENDYSMEVLREQFTDHPIYTNLLVNEALTATALQVLFRSNEELLALEAQINDLNAQYQAQGLSADQEAELERLQIQVDPLRQELNRTRGEEIEQIRGFITKYEGEATIHMGGVHVLADQLIEIISNDLVVFGMAIAIGICLMLLVLFRALRWVCIPILCCLSSILSTMGLFSLLGIKATVISSNFIALQLILTLAIVIHLIVQFRESSAAQPDASQRDLIRDTLREKIGPCFFAGLTTSVGFGSLIFSGIAPVIAFGWMMIIAMGFSIAVSLTLFPVILELLPKHKQRDELAVFGATVKGLANAALHRRALIGIVSVGIALFSIVGILRLDVENSFINYFKDSTQIHQELAYIDEEFGGSTPLDLIYTINERPDNPDIVMSARSVQMLQLIQHRMKEHEAVGRVLSAVNLTDLARELNGGPLTEYELTTAYWLMDENFREDLLGAFYDPESGQARINIWIQDLTEDLNRAQLLEDIRAQMEEMGVPESDYQLTNMFVLYQDILQRLFSSQILTLGLVYAALFIVFLLIFRSPRLALIALVPNLLPTLAVLGIMGWLNIPLDLMTITIAAIAMGIAVDDTIHYMHRFQEERAEHGYEEAVQRTHSSVGLAILYTSLLIMAGFSMLAFSDFVPSILFGLLTSMAMALAFLVDLCLLPILLRWGPKVSGQTA